MIRVHRTLLSQCLHIKGRSWLWTCVLPRGRQSWCSCEQSFELYFKLFRSIIDNPYLLFWRLLFFPLFRCKFSLTYYSCGQISSLFLLVLTLCFVVHVSVRFLFCWLFSVCSKYNSFDLCVISLNITRDCFLFSSSLSSYQTDAEKIAAWGK